MSSNTFLIVEDEHRLRQTLRSTLITEGHQVIEVANTVLGMESINTHKPDFIILGSSVLYNECLEFLTTLRGWSDIPVLVISAKSLESEKVATLDAGADDYLIQPIGMAELLARIRAIGRRSNTPRDNNAVFQFSDVIIDRSKRQVKRKQEIVHLTPHEYHLLTLLVSYPGKVMTQRQLLKEVWGASHLDDNHYLRIYMARLRQKLEVDPANPQYFLTETGVGYRFCLNAKPLQS